VSLVFFYPQFKKLTGAERLILKLADYTARRLPEEHVVVLTHRFAEECRPAVGTRVEVVETGWRMRVSGNHYIDAAVEYALGPALALRVPTYGLHGIIFFGPPSVPAMWFFRRLALRFRGKRVPVLYFCYEPPRFIYSDTAEIAARMGVVGRLLRPLAAVYRALDRRMVGAADHVLSNSPYGARRIWSAYRKAATVIEHGVDFTATLPGQVNALRERYCLGDRPVAVTVNHLHPRKRIDLFLRAVSFASKQVSRATALVVGGGPEEAALKALAEELGMKPGRDVVFTGAVPEEDLAAHYALGDVYVHTGREESFGLSVIEALYAGLPVVSVNEGGPCDTVHHGTSGYLAPPTPEALGSALARLLADRGRARQMGEEGARFVREHFQWERGVDTLLGILAQAWRENRAAGRAVKTT
jgi:glycosyltransferase involved in cell wall biosynthesis